MSKKNNYWVQRAIEQERLKDEIARDYIERTEKQLREYERDLKREIEAFYARYAIDHKMTQKEALKYLRDDERKEFQEVTLDKFREMALDPNADQALLDALSYRHRISRKEALLAEIQSKTAQLYAKPGGLKDTTDQALTEVYVKGKIETAKTFAKAGIVHEPKLDRHLIKERMNYKWTDKHFSERVWGHNKQTYESIAKVLNNGFTGGWSLDRIKKELSDKIKGVPLHRIDTLIKTEATAFNTLAMKDMLLELNTKKYSIVAVIDSRTSEICSHQNEKVYDMDKLEIGVNAPPFHPRCRSTIAPVEDEDDFDYFQEPEDRKANGKRTLDEILADWEKKAEELLSESEQSHKGIDRTLQINRKYIKSRIFDDRFKKLGEDREITKIISGRAKQILNHRSGTEFEDLVFIDSRTGDTLSRLDFDVPRKVLPSKRMMKFLKDSEPRTIIAIHNHPGGRIPSFSDFMVAEKRKYKYGIVVGHDGSIFKYTIEDNARLEESIYNIFVAKLGKKDYTVGELERFSRELKRIGVILEVL